jgi:hypothetical protein
MLPFTRGLREPLARDRRAVAWIAKPHPPFALDWARFSTGTSARRTTTTSARGWGRRR